MQEAIVKLAEPIKVDALMGSSPVGMRLGDWLEKLGVVAVKVLPTEVYNMVIGEGSTCGDIVCAAKSGDMSVTLQAE